jgi:hypothetical protein
MKTEEEIRKNCISEDTILPEFFVKFNLALQELENQELGFIAFLDAVTPYLKYFAEQNNKTLHELFVVIEKMDKNKQFARLII